jgi:hypothetical protein
MKNSKLTRTAFIAGLLVRKAFTDSQIYIKTVRKFGEFPKQRIPRLRSGMNKGEYRKAMRAANVRKISVIREA